jgi:hypothetical protein
MHSCSSFADARSPPAIAWPMAGVRPRAAAFFGGCAIDRRPDQTAPVETVCPTLARRESAPVKAIAHIALVEIKFTKKCLPDIILNLGGARSE